ncbi:DUF4290 domain-containing protein [Rudanella lutea]|uniref:DUF4290 domain-containing protein n=1 Tax=Rudanella lutea TaxID=451374 RepID=UPI0003A23D52|nr:DUF4290 domain-containing protein [Rudanella lutea]
MKEYGSNIQKLVDNMVNIEDREQRTRYAHILVELMRQIHPNMKDGQDYYNKLWDDLYIISGFTLDVDSPYPPPSEEALGKQPQPVPYNTHNLRFRHFGYNLDLLIKKALAVEDTDERRAFVSYLFRLMKSFYTTWNKESVEDETIYQSMLELSKGQLADDVDLIRREGLVESTPRERTGESTQPQRLSQQPQRGNNRQGYGNNRPNYGNNQRNAGGNNNGRNNGPGGRNNNNGRNNGPGGRNNNNNNNGGRNDFRGNTGGRNNDRRRR